jgi:hypothetical protein
MPTRTNPDKSLNEIVENCEKGHRTWTELIVQANQHKVQGLFDQALELYTKALEEVIHLVEVIELAIELKIPALHHFTLTTQSLAETYESISLPDEAERLLLTHFICLKKITQCLKTPLVIRDLARQEIYHSRRYLIDLYNRNERKERAEIHAQRCHELYYSLLA